MGRILNLLTTSLMHSWGLSKHYWNRDVKVPSPHIEKLAGDMESIVCPLSSTDSYCRTMAEFPIPVNSTNGTGISTTKAMNSCLILIYNHIGHPIHVFTSNIFKGLKIKKIHKRRDHTLFLIEHQHSNTFFIILSLIDFIIFKKFISWE